MNEFKKHFKGRLICLVTDWIVIGEKGGVKGVKLMKQGGH